jgi:hypothetical protein
MKNTNFDLKDMSFAFDGMSITNPTCSSCGRFTVDPITEYGFEIEGTGGGCTALQKKVEGILAEVPGLAPAFIQSMKSQSSNIAKVMVQSIPGLLGNLTDKDIEANELKPDTSKASFLSKLSGFFADNQGA